MKNTRCLQQTVCILWTSCKTMWKIVAVILYEEESGMTKKVSRLGYIDFIKCIALNGIILAHVGSPSIVMMLRSFDVPCMVMLSSLLASYSYKKFSTNKFSVPNYLLFRFKRLVFPTWVFLTLYFGLYWLLSGHRYDVKYYLASYLLTRYGIGYVWIILIYLYCALLVPLFQKTGLKYKSILSVLLLYLLYEIAYYLQLGTENKILMSTLYYIIPYGSVAFLGFHYNAMSAKTKYCILSISLFVFVSFAMYYRISEGSFQLVQISKYPPRLYYLSYGVLGSFTLLLLCEKLNFIWFSHPIIQFISMHSMWIYLWHILWLTIYNVIKLPEIWLIKYPVVCIGAGLTVVIANKCFDLIEKKVHQEIFKYLRG